MKNKYIVFFAGVLIGTIWSLFGMVSRDVEAQAPSFWQVEHAPAANAQATATQAAAGAGLRNIVDCINATFVAGTTAPAAAQVTLNVRDGASGAGNIIWTGQFALPAVAGQSAPPIQECGLGIPGTANTAMTIEFSAAGGANTFEAVSMKGRTGQ